MAHETMARLQPRKLAQRQLPAFEPMAAEDLVFATSEHVHNGCADQLPELAATERGPDGQPDVNARVVGPVAVRESGSIEHAH